MKQETKAILDSETKSELKRLKNIEKAHEMLRMEHELQKKAYNIVRIEKRDLLIYRHTTQSLPIDAHASSL